MSPKIVTDKLDNILVKDFVNAAVLKDLTSLEFKRLSLGYIPPYIKVIYQPDIP